MSDITRTETQSLTFDPLPISRRLKIIVKKVLFPGLDLHTRSRYKFLTRFFLPGNIDTLDAGCGNGALSYAAFRKGNRVLGVTYSSREVRDTSQLFTSMAVPQERLNLIELNLYQLQKVDGKFDQIICSECLEHITGQEAVLASFAEKLNPGGRLILCCPYAPHPENALGRTNEPEDGRHVRDGYTIESYRQLLEPMGFVIVDQVGLGSPLLCRLDWILRRVRGKVGDALAFPLFLLFMPLTLLDYTNPKVPLSLAVIAEKTK